jgi:formate hydrogenlyase transcriptional activator
MLLRVIQERVIERVGGDSLAVDVRIIAATNRDLFAEVKAGRFRADLYYRLHVFPIAVPPLRERVDDIRDLVAHFAIIFSRKHWRSDKRISAASLKLLAAHDWPGNIRELQNVVERAVIVSDGEELMFDPTWLVGSTVAESAKTWAAQEKKRILEALASASGRVYGPGGAAHRLGLNPTTLYGKMRKHGISKTDAN